MLQRMRWTMPLVLLACQTEPVLADVLADWNEKTVAFVTPRMVPAAGQRVVATVQVAMFDAINSVERRYKPYLVQLPATAKRPERQRPPPQRQLFWRDCIRRRRLN